MTRALCAGALLAVAGAGTAAADPLTFSAPQPITSSRLNAVSCPSSSLCLAAGDGGTVFASSTPTLGGWASTAVDGSRRLLSLSCSSPGFCAVTDNSSRVLTSTDAGGLSHWRAVSIDPHRWVPAIACPTRHLCVAVDRHGAVIASTRPTGNSRAWHRTQLVHGSLVAVSCASARLCVAVEPPNHVLVSAHPAGGRRAWRSLRLFSPSLDFESFLQDVSCPSSHQCVASVSSVGGDVSLWAASRPTSQRSWHQAAFVDSLSHDGDIITHVSCGSSALCVEVDGSLEFGAIDVFDSTDPGHAWAPSSYPGGTDSDFATGVACASTGPCVVVTRSGEVIAGSRS